MACKLYFALIWKVRLVYPVKLYSLLAATICSYKGKLSEMMGHGGDKINDGLIAYNGVYVKVRYRYN